MSVRNVNIFAQWYFPDIRINFAKAGEILGTANLKEMIEFVMLDIGRIASDMKRQKEKVLEISEDRPVVKFVVDEIEGFVAADEVVVKNRMFLVSLLQEQLRLAKKQKPMLPVCRNQIHFELGDDVMIHIGNSRKHRSSKILAKHDWIPAKILHARANPICHSNKSHSKNGPNSGHYYAASNQNQVFKRQDFYRLRRMAKRGFSSDLKFLKLLPKYVYDMIAKGTVYPLSDKRLAREQAEIIRTAYRVTDTNCYRDNVEIIAKKYRIKLSKKRK